MKKDLTTLPVRLDREQYDYLRDRAYREHRPMAELVRQAIKNMMEFEPLDRIKDKP